MVLTDTVDGRGLGVYEDVRRGSLGLLGLRGLHPKPRFRESQQGLFHSLAGLHSM